MKAITLLVPAVLFASTHALELTAETWDQHVGGKTVFIKFLAPCESKTTLVADVDCTAGGKSKCDEVGVRGYPSIKYGDPDDLQDYQGGRDFATLKKFAEGLGPLCSPANIDLCDDEKKKKIEEYTALEPAKRDEMIAEKEAESKKIEADFKTFVEGLQKQYSEANEKKDKDVEAIKSSGLGLLKAVHAFEKKNKKSEL